MKGSTFDMIAILVILLISAFSIVFVANLITEVDTANDANNVLNSTLLETGKNSFNAFNLGFPILLVGLIGAVVVGSFFIRTHPIFIPVSILMIFIIMLLTPVFSNAYSTFASNPALTQVTNQYTVIAFIFANLPAITIIGLTIIIIALYAKREGSGGV